MKIALLGSRGIPAGYSGFETFYENLAVRLVKRGHDVTVYNRTGYVTYRGSYYRGVRLVRLPSIKSKHLDTISHTLISALHALKEKFDIYYFCIAGNSPVALMTRLLGGIVVLNVDGSDADREKWQVGAKAYIHFAERIAGKSAHAVIADSRAVSRLYRDHYQTPTVYIPYGANPWHRDKERSNTHVLKRFGLEHDRYILFVSRMTPENKADLLVKAFNRAHTDLKLVLVGDAPYVDDYKRYLDDLCANNPRIIRTGYLWGDDYRQISSHCRFFVLPSTINGTRPVLLDQMAFANCVVVANNPAQQEVVRDCGVYFNKDRAEESLSEVIELLTRNYDLVRHCREKAFRRVSRVYSWDRITRTYEMLFKRLMHRVTRFRLS